MVAFSVAPQLGSPAEQAQVHILVVAAALVLPLALAQTRESGAWPVAMLSEGRVGA